MWATIAACSHFFVPASLPLPIVQAASAFMDGFSGRENLMVTRSREFQALRRRTERESEFFSDTVKHLNRNQEYQKGLGVVLRNPK